MSQCQSQLQNRGGETKREQTVVRNKERQSDDNNMIINRSRSETCAQPQSREERRREGNGIGKTDGEEKRKK